MCVPFRYISTIEGKSHQWTWRNEFRKYLIFDLISSILPRKPANIIYWMEIYNKLTRTLASVKFVHIAISSRVDISGYRFLLNVCSNSCNCCDVKCVRCRRCRLFFLSFLVSSAVTIGSSWMPEVFSVFTAVSFIDRFTAI